MIRNLKNREQACIKDIQNHYTLTCRVWETAPQKPSLSAQEKEAAQVIPIRNPDLKGPLGRSFLQEQLKEKDVSLNLPIYQRDSRITYEILNFINGKNSVLDIRNAVSAEYEPVPVEWVMEFIQVLAEAGIVK